MLPGPSACWGVRLPGALLWALMTVLPLAVGASVGPRVAAAPRSEPPPQLAQLRLLVGEWRCEGERLALASEPGRALRARLSVRAEMEGFWFASHYVEQVPKGGAGGLERHHWWGYRAQDRLLVTSFVGSGGDSGTASSPGWSGDELIFNGSMETGAGERLPWRYILTRHGNQAFDDRTEVNRQGEWIPMLTHASCRR